MSKLPRRLAMATMALCLGPAVARAADIWGGVYAHGIGVHQQQEGGADFMLGLRSERIDSLPWLGRPAVHAIVSANTNVATDFAAVGVDWPIPLLRSRWYLRPGIGLAYTTGKASIGDYKDAGLSPEESDRRRHLSRTRIDFGSHALFEPEVALGYHLGPRWRAELSYIHLSNGQVFHSGKNQGMDDIGVRLGYRFN